MAKRYYTDHIGRRQKFSARLDPDIHRRLKRLMHMHVELLRMERTLENLEKPYYDQNEPCGLRGCIHNLFDQIKTLEWWIRIGGKA